MNLEINKKKGDLLFLDEFSWNVELKIGQVDVWCFSLELEKENLFSLKQLLSEDELARFQRFRIEQARNHFLAARGLLRIVIARYLHVHPRHVEFQYGPLGKPALTKKIDGFELYFNMSHSYGLGLYSVSLGRKVGVDIEKIRPDLPCINIAERYFSPFEVETLKKLPANQQNLGFFNCWTRKEAFLKARGEGIASNLDQFEVSLIPGESARLLGHRSGFQEISEWLIEDLDVGPGHRAALAVEGRQIALVRTISHEDAVKMTYRCL